MKLKLLAISLFLILYSLLALSPSNGFFIPAAHAQSTNSNYLNTNPDVPQNFHTYTQSVFIEILATISCQLGGYDPTNPNGRCLGIDPATGKIGYVENGGGAVGFMGTLISSTFYIPVSTYDYGSYMASNFGITKNTYAADTPANNLNPSQPADSTAPENSLGFNALLPTLKLWQSFRNITYLLFVILFVIVGLGIMFRVKIDPRTVMTLQNQIPKIIMAIIFVTLSYAIAGFLIDLMYVFTFIVISIFTQIGTDPNGVMASSPFGAVGGLGGMSGISWGVGGSIAGIIKSIFDGSTGKILETIIGGIFGSMVGGTGGGFAQGNAQSTAAGAVSTIGRFGGPIGAGIGIFAGMGLGFLGGKLAIGPVVNVIAYVIIIIAIFQALLRLWFQLIKCYIFILMGVVFAPFYIASGLVPGRSGVGAWIRSMLSNLIVFPATITIFLLGKTFTDAFSRSEPGYTPFIPPLTGDYLDPQRFASIIGLGIILMAPEAVNMVRDAIKSPEFKYSSAIGKSLSAGAGAASGTVKESLGTGKTFISGTPKPGDKGLGAVAARIFH